jgi:hypothetical protein
MTMPFTKPFIFKKTAKNLFSVNELQIHDITMTNQQARRRGTQVLKNRENKPKTGKEFDKQQQSYTHSGIIQSSMYSTDCLP